MTTQPEVGRVLPVLDMDDLEQTWIRRASTTSLRIHTRTSLSTIS